MGIGKWSNMRGQILLDQREIVKQIPEYVYEVSPAFVDNHNLRQFSTIDAANNHAIANMPDWPTKVSIMVHPGLYEESITDSHYRIHIMGLSNTTHYLKGVTLYNTGIDSDHWPIRYTGPSTLNLSNITIETDPNEVYGEYPPLRCVNCSFLSGYFDEYLGSGSRGMDFTGCYFDSIAFQLNGVTDRRVLAFRNCEIDDGPLELNSTNTSGNLKFVKFERTISSSDVLVAGDWRVNSYNSEMYGGGKFTFDTTGFVIFDGTLLPEGVHFKSNPAGLKRFIDCNFINPSMASTHRDISADVTITDVDYSGNAQQWGICDCIHIRNPEKHVGAHDDMYYDLQSAISSITNGGTVKLWENLVDLPELTLPNTNVAIVINGQKKYSITFAGDIVEIGADRKFGFVDMVQVSGGNIQLNGNNAEISLESCQYVVGYLTLTNGAFAIVYKSSLFGSSGHSAINVDNLTTPMIVGYSRIQGSTGNPAVLISVDADGVFKGKFSTFIHGDKDTSAPILYTGASGKVDISMYSCGLNAAWNPAKIYNVIGAANNTTDVKINF